MPLSRTATPRPSPRHGAIALRASVSQLSRAMRSALPACDASVAQLSVLGLLHRHGALSPTELARREGVRLQTLTRLLASLESEGWATRHADARDGRRSVLRLTAGGARLLAAQVRRREASLEAAISRRLSPAEQQALLGACTLIERLAADLVGLAEPAAQP